MHYTILKYNWQLFTYRKWKFDVLIKLLHSKEAPHSGALLYHAVVKHLRTKNSLYITSHFAIIHLVSNRKVLTILGTATDFLTEAFINVAAFLIRAITAIFFVITNLVLRNALAIFAHKKRAVTWLLWKTKKNTQLGVIY